MKLMCNPPASSAAHRTAVSVPAAALNRPRKERYKAHALDQPLPPVQTDRSPCAFHSPPTQRSHAPPATVRNGRSDIPALCIIDRRAKHSRKSIQLRMLHRQHYRRESAHRRADNSAIPPPSYITLRVRDQVLSHEVLIAVFRLTRRVHEVRRPSLRHHQQGIRRRKLHHLRIARPVPVPAPIAMQQIEHMNRPIHRQRRSRNAIRNIPSQSLRVERPIHKALRHGSFNCGLRSLPARTQQRKQNTTRDRSRSASVDQATFRSWLRFPCPRFTLTIFDTPGSCIVTP